MPTELERRFQLVLMQAKQSQLRAEYVNACMLSGVYKKRKVRVGTDGPYLNEQELLEEEVGRQQRHIELAEEFINEAMGISSQIEKQRG